MRVPAFEFDGWQVDYQPRKGHVFTRDRDRILVRKGKYPNQLVVQRSYFDRVLNLAPAYYGLHGGGYQGGDGIVLQPKWTRGNRDAMDGTILRHHIGRFADDGTIARGDGKRYPLMTYPQGDGYQRIDGAHYIRAIRHAIAEFDRSRDPVARMWMMLCDADIERRFPNQPFIDGEGPEYSLATMYANVWATPHRAKLGVIRELAWSLRTRVETQRIAPTADRAAWIAKFVDMLYLGQANNGTFADNEYGGGASEDNQPWDVQQPGYRVLTRNEGEFPAFQVPFLIRALYEASVVVHACAAHARTCIERYKGLWEGCMKVPDGYAPNVRGVPKWVIVSRDGQLLDRVTEGVGASDTSYDADMFEVWKDLGL